MSFKYIYHFSTVSLHAVLKLCEALVQTSGVSAHK